MPSAWPVDPGEGGSGGPPSRRAGVRGSLASAGVAAARIAREPVLPILVLAGVFDLLSGAPVTHGGLLIGAAAALGLDALRRRPDRAERGGGSPGRAIAIQASPRWLAALGAYALVVGSFARYSWPASVAVLVPAIAGVVLAWEGPMRAGRGEPRFDPRGARAWAVAFVALALWELTNLLLQPSLVQGSYDHPTLSVLMDPILATHAGRSAFLALWLLLGWFLLER